MRFDDLHILLDAEVQAVLPTFLKLAERGPVAGFAEMIESEPRFRSQVDMAVRHWADHRQWPRMDSDVAHHVVTRLNVALRLLASLRPLCVEASSPESHVLAWLLADYWRIAGRSRWLHSLTDPRELET